MVGEAVAQLLVHEEAVVVEARRGRADGELVSDDPGPDRRELAGALARAARAGSASGRSLAVVERTLRGGEVTPLHAHDMPEALHALGDGLAVFVGGEEVELAAGETVIAPAGIPHSVRALRGPVRYLAGSLVRSVSRYEDFLRAVAPPLERAADWTESDDAFRLAALAAENGIAVLAAPGLLPEPAREAA